MERQETIKQIVAFYETSSDNSFTAMTILQEQAEKMFNMCSDKATWFPEEGKKVIREWEQNCAKGRAEFKSTVDNNFKKVEEYFGFVIPIFMGK